MTRSTDRLRSVMKKRAQDLRGKDWNVRRSEEEFEEEKRKQLEHKAIRRRDLVARKKRLAPIEGGRCNAPLHGGGRRCRMTNLRSDGRCSLHGGIVLPEEPAL